MPVQKRHHPTCLSAKERIFHQHFLTVSPPQSLKSQQLRTTGTFLHNIFDWGFDRPLILDYPGRIIYRAPPSSQAF